MDSRHQMRLVIDHWRIDREADHRGGVVSRRAEPPGLFGPTIVCPLPVLTVGADPAVLAVWAPNAPHCRGSTHRLFTGPRVGSGCVGIRSQRVRRSGSEGGELCRTASKSGARQAHSGRCLALSTTTALHESRPDNNIFKSTFQTSIHIITSVPSNHHCVFEPIAELWRRLARGSARV